MIKKLSAMNHVLYRLSKDQILDAVIHRVGALIALQRGHFYHQRPHHSVIVQFGV